MGYELYIDVLFLVNLFYDFLLLYTIKSIMKDSITWGHIFVGAILGSGLTCLIIACPLNGIVKFILCHVVVNIVMIRVGLKRKKIREIGKAVVVLYVVSIFFGGILEFFAPYLHVEMLYFVIAILCVFFIKNLWKNFLKEKRRHNTKCIVILQEGNIQKEVRALIDTGNTLTDPVSGDPVTVIGKVLAKQMWKEKKQQQGIRYIPFRTINDKGMMPVFRVEKMQVGDEDGILIEHPLLGVCERQMSETEEYQMILNPDILGGL